ncbi:hypothetical protein [Moraxella atlantae]|uniref:Predicted acetyltransferase n=1 Tax=Faucicola atlantae TaxID=34059 RepID=A0A378Q400_9GAMM|nr:hypothetical protein [Moraxella atlantae]OPH34769.1 hypothetical protein B5J92_06820 [Moraxella atlantae]STY95385.1 Predicted acetyltransferase [Moraxella atlantae]
MKNYRIRREQPSDFAHIHTLIKTAFATADDSDHQEQFLVERLRQDPAFLPKLALVAEHIVKTELYRTGSFVVGLSNHNDRYP